MKGFRFRLDSVRKLRKSELDARRSELQRAQQQSDADRSVADALVHRAEVAEEALTKTLAAGIGGEALRSALEARETLGRAAENAARHAEEAAAHEDASRVRVVDAWRRSESLQALRGKALDLWQREDRRREQKDGDESAGRAGRGVRTVLIIASTFVAMSVPPTIAAAAEEVQPSVERVTAASVAGDDLSAETLRRILAELRVREQALERRERDVIQRERVADELTADTTRLLAEIEAVRTAIEKRIGSSDGEGAARISRLAKTYAEMPPSHAAPLLEELAPELATAIVSKMKPKKSAAVLAQMSKPNALRMSQLAADPLDGVSSDGPARRTP